MDKNKQIEILEKSFASNVEYWKRTLGSDASPIEAYEHALQEVPTTNPFRCRNAETFDEDVREEFIKYRYMDVYGTKWKDFYDKRGSE